MSVAISGLTELTASPASNDYFVILDVSDVTQAPTGTTKRISTANVFTSVVATSSLQVMGSLQVSGATTLASTLSVTGALTAASLALTSGATGISMNGTTVLRLSLGVFNYTLFDNPGGTHSLFLGDATDPANYYDNTTHHFRDRSGSGNFLTLSAATAAFGADVTVAGSLSVSSNVTVTGTLTVTTLSLTSLSATSAVISGNLTAGSLGTPIVSFGGTSSGKLFTGSSSMLIRNSSDTTTLVTVDNGGTVTFAFDVAVTGTLTAGTFSPTTLSVTGAASVSTSSTSGLTIGGGGGLGSNPGIHLVGVTNGAGASSGTLTNAPASGNPGFWLPIDINGVTRFIPCW